MPNGKRGWSMAGWVLAAMVAVFATAARGDDAAFIARLEAMGGGATFVAADDTAGRRLTDISIPDGSALSATDITSFGGLTGLRKLQIYNCRGFDDDAAGSLAGLKGLRSLAITNSGLTDAGVATIVASFPELTDLDLSSNTNLTGAALRSIAGLTKLERLNLMQCRFNDLHTRRLAKLPELRSLDLRGNMEAGDMTLMTVGKLPHLSAFKHRSSTVTDEGLRALGEVAPLESLLIQDFAITDDSGPHLAALEKLSSLEVFRCQGFGTRGVLALGGLPLTRLTLRDLPDVGDEALAVVERLPGLKRLYLHELASVGDDGLRHLSAAHELEILDIWSLPLMTDAAVDVIAGLTNLKELSIRETSVTEAAIPRILSLPHLRSLTFRNGALSAPTVAALRARSWAKLDLGTTAD